MATVQQVRDEDGLGDYFVAFSDARLQTFLDDAVLRYEGRKAHKSYDRVLVLVAAHLAEVRRRAAGKSPNGGVPNAPVKRAKVDKVETEFAVAAPAAPAPGSIGAVDGSTPFGAEALDLLSRMPPSAIAPGGGRWR